MLIKYKKININGKIGHVMYIDNIKVATGSVESKSVAKQMFDNNIKSIIDQLNVLLNVEIGNIQEFIKKEEKVEIGRHIMNMSCRNNKCVNYFEDMCLCGKILFLNESGECECFEAGVNDSYKELEDK